MEENRKNNHDEVFSKRIKAGRKRTYFIDVKPTRNNDYYLTITESKKDFRQPNQYIKHKIFLYKEDFNKFLSALTETIDHVKTELITDYDFDSFDRNEDIDDITDLEIDNETDKDSEEKDIL